MNKLILIDADILTYMIGFSVEKSIYICDGRVYTHKSRALARSKLTGKQLHSRKGFGSITQIRRNLDKKLESMFLDLGSDEYKMYLTASNIGENFRSKIATLMPYKGNRIDAQKPVHYIPLRELLVNRYKAEIIKGQEADDAIGIMQYKQAKKYSGFESTIIASIDKDLKCLEGWHYHLKTRELSYINEDEAMKNFYGQLLLGDVVDSIPGLAKILKIRGRHEEYNNYVYGKPGYIKRFNLFKETHTADECKDYVINEYNKFGFGEEEINEIGQLIWIRRNEDEIWHL